MLLYRLVRAQMPKFGPRQQAPYPYCLLADKGLDQNLPRVAEIFDDHMSEAINPDNSQG
jgi:hypothetical protein